MSPAPREVDGVSILSALKPPCRGPMVTADVLLFIHTLDFFVKKKTEANPEKYCQEPHLLKNVLWGR